jgi:hypothetical protein
MDHEEGWITYIVNSVHLCGDSGHIAGLGMALAHIRLWSSGLWLPQCLWRAGPAGPIKCHDAGHISMGIPARGCAYGLSAFHGSINLGLRPPFGLQNADLVSPAHTVPENDTAVTTSNGRTGNSSGLAGWLSSARES